MEPLYRQALKIQHTTVGENHPHYARTLNNLANLYVETGSYDLVEPLYRQALEIQQTTVGENHPEYAETLGDLARLYLVMSDYRAAEPLYRQALEIQEATVGENHADYADALSNLAGLYFAMHDYYKAERLIKQAVDITRSALGERHYRYAQNLLNLGTLYFAMHDNAAEPAFDQAREIFRSALGEQSLPYAQSLYMMGMLSCARDEYTTAEPLLRQVLEIFHTGAGKNSLWYAQSLGNLGVLEWGMGNYAAAEPLFQQALATFRTALGECHPVYGQCMQNLALLYVATNRAADGLSLLRKATGIDDRILGKVSSITSDSGRMAYLTSLQRGFYLYLSLLLEYFPDSVEVVQTGVDLTLRRKAIAAEALAVQRDAILRGRHPDLVPQLQELTLLRAKLSQHMLLGPGPGNPDAYSARLAEWTDRFEDLQADLAQQIPEMNLERRLDGVERRAVAQALPVHGALVEFVRLDIFDFAAVAARGEARWKPARYIAFVVRGGAPDGIRMIDLGEAAEIDDRIAALRQAISADVTHDKEGGDGYGTIEAADVTVYSDRPRLEAAIELGTRDLRRRRHYSQTQDRSRLGTELREILLDPILPALTGCTHLFLAPDGDLSRLPFEVLPLDSERHVIDAYQLSYLSVGRDLLRFDTPAARQPTAPVIVADPDFDLGGPGAREFRAGVPFQRLGGSLREGKQLASLLRVVPLLNAGGLEQVLKEHQSPLILHLATHGFFLPAPKRNPDNDQFQAPAFDVGPALRLGRLTTVDNPLLRSGLALAGANTWLQEQDGALEPAAEDGLLTAVDVAGLNLLDTELIVLSACETGLGVVQVGEGVFGLRRACVLAGAKTLVMSLWKVPDEATRELMVDFYQRILAAKPRAEALRESQHMLKERYPNPLFWGGFICQGQPGPLPRSRHRHGQHRSPQPGIC